MAIIKKAYVVIFDCETVQDGTIFDAAYIVMEKNAPFREVDSGAFILLDNCKKPLFSLNGVTGNKDNHFSAASLARRTQAYRDMLKRGERTLISVVHLNARLAMLAAKYNKPTFYAYNAKFDLECLKKSGIAVDAIFKDKQCLMEKAINTYLPRASFKKFALQNGAFTPKNFLSFTAERVYQYLTSNPAFKEAHTALEDVLIEKEIYINLARQKRKSNPIGQKINWKAISLSEVYASVHRDLT